MSLVGLKISIEETEKNIANTQKEINRLRRDIEDAINHISQVSPFLEDSVFWNLIQKMRDCINAYGYENGVKHFIDNVCHSHISPNFNRHTAIQFVKTYLEKTNNIRKKLDEVIVGYSDDGFYDIVDSFLLFGQERYEMALKGKIEGNSRDQYIGENHIVTNLQTALYEEYACQCRYEFDKN